MSTSSLALIANNIAISQDENTVVLELICTSELGASVLYDDLLSRLSSERGLHLWVKCGQGAAEGTEAS